VSFLQPGLAFAALLAAALPFLLHLLLRRPRATEWPSTMLLRRAIERLRRRRRLEQWVLLTLRALALALAGVGMAGPIARALDGGRGQRELWIVVDDGAASAERAEDGTTALESVRAKVRGELDGLRSGDRAALVLAAQPTETRVEPTVDLERVRRELDALKPRAVPTNLAGAIEKCLPPEAGAAREVLVASSFRAGSVDPDSPLPASWKERARSVRWTSTRPFDSIRPNRSVRGVTVGRGPGEVAGSGEVPVRVELTRGMGDAATDPLLVRGSAGDLLGRADAAWPAGGAEVRQDIRARAPKDGAFVVEAADDAQPLDDRMAVVSAVSGAPRVCVLGRRSGDADIERLPASAWIVRALEAAGVEPQEMEPSTLALRPPREVDTAIVTRPDLVDAAGWTWLGSFARDGGTVVLMPVADLPAQTWMVEADRALGVSIGRQAEASDGAFRLSARQPRGALFALLGAEVDALAEPVSMQRRWSLAPSGVETQPALVFEDGAPAMTVTRPRDGAGVVVQLAFTPEVSVTDLPLKPFMVPMFQEIARAGRVIASAQQACRSGEVAWLGSASAGGLLRSMDGATAIEIDGEGRTTRPIPAPGLWKVEQRDGRRRLVAVRLDPAAASVERVEGAAFEAWRAALGPWTWCGERASADERALVSDDSPFTFPLLAAALVTLLAECAWSRRGSPHRGPAEVRA